MSACTNLFQNLNFMSIITIEFYQYFHIRGKSQLHTDVIFAIEPLPWIWFNNGLFLRNPETHLDKRHQSTQDHSCHLPLRIHQCTDYNHQTNNDTIVSSSPQTYFHHILRWKNMFRIIRLTMTPNQLQLVFKTYETNWSWGNCVTEQRIHARGVLAMMKESVIPTSSNFGKDKRVEGSSIRLVGKQVL